MVDAAGIETDCRPLHFAAQLAPALGTDCDFKMSPVFQYLSSFSLGMILSRKVATKSFIYMFIPGFPVCIEDDHHCLPLLDALFQKL